MKKFLLFVLSILIFSTEVYGYNYDIKFKKEFYERFSANYFQTLQEQLMTQGYKSHKVYQYVSTLRARLNKQELENLTWNCASKYPPKQIYQNETINKCFSNWSYNFMFEKNSDAIEILK